VATYRTGDFRKGLKVLIDGDPYLMVEMNFRKPGKGNAIYAPRKEGQIEALNKRGPGLNAVTQINPNVMQEAAEKQVADRSCSASRTLSWQGGYILLSEGSLTRNMYVEQYFLL
jgi:hypothetical protein